MSLQATKGTKDMATTGAMRGRIPCLYHLVVDRDLKEPHYPHVFFTFFKILLYRIVSGDTSQEPKTN